MWSCTSPSTSTSLRFSTSHSLNTLTYGCCHAAQCCCGAVLRGVETSAQAAQVCEWANSSRTWREHGGPHWSSHPGPRQLLLATLLVVAPRAGRRSAPHHNKAAAGRPGGGGAGCRLQVLETMLLLLVRRAERTPLTAVRLTSRRRAHVLTAPVRSQSAPSSWLSTGRAAAACCCFWLNVLASCCIRRKPSECADRRHASNRDCRAPKRDARLRAGALTRGAAVLLKRLWRTRSHASGGRLRRP